MQLTLSIMAVLAGLLVMLPNLEQPSRRLLDTQELLTNGGFETGRGRPTGWRQTRGSLVQDSTTIRNGSFSAAFSHNNVTEQYFYQTAPVSGDTAYTLTGYCVKNDANAYSARLVLAWYSSTGGTGAPISTLTSAFLTSDDPAFQQLTIGPTNAPASANSARVRVAMETFGATATIYCDDLSLTTEATTPTETATPTATTPTTARPSRHPPLHPPKPLHPRLLAPPALLPRLPSHPLHRPRLLTPPARLPRLPSHPLHRPRPR